MLKRQREALLAALEGAIEELESYQVDWARLSPESEDYDPQYTPELSGPTVRGRRALEALKDWMLPEGEP